ALQFTLAALAPGAERNIRWALGAVTWVNKARLENRAPSWEQILPDIRAGGFEGFEPYTAATLQVNDENIGVMEKLAPKYSLRMSGIYWGDRFHEPAEHERLLKECHRFLGYLKRFGADRLIIGPPSPKVEDEKQAIASMARLMNAIGRIALEQYHVKVG